MSKMKKTILGLCAMALTLAACQSEGYKVNGVAEGFNDGDTLYFYSEIGMEMPADTIIVSSGKFSIEGAAVDSVTMCSVVAADGSSGAIFFRENGSIDITLSKINPSKVGGTRANDGWQLLNDLQADYTAKVEALTAPLYQEEADEAKKQEIMAKYEALEKEMLADVIGIAEDNIDNAMGYFVVTSMAGNPEMQAERLKSLIERMPAEYKQRQEIADIMASLEAAAKVEKGMTIPAFSLPNADGEEVNIMDEVAKNKVTIMDFWASWCGPCCAEMPTMVSLYDQYKEKGLGIVGISLDNDKEAWTKGIADMDMTWTQLGDMKGWQSAPVELFQVKAIPFVVVVDEKGTILEKGLRGAALELFIGELLKD